MRRTPQTLRDRVGFTLVELMVVISIIGILLAIVSASFSTARASARDKARMADLANLQQAFRLYAEENGAYPDYPGGVAIGVGGTIDSSVSNYFTKIPTDPKSGDTIHEYWYDSVFECDGVEYAALMATEMERPVNSNFETVCGVQASIFSVPKLVKDGEKTLRKAIDFSTQPEIVEAASVSGQCWIAGTGSCNTVCSGVSGTPAGGSCSSGETRHSVSISELGTSQFIYGCWGGGGCSTPNRDTGVNSGSSNMCYAPGQKKDNNSTDRVVSCSCNVPDTSVCATPPPPPPPPPTNTGDINPGYIILLFERKF